MLSVEDYSGVILETQGQRRWLIWGIGCGWRWVLWVFVGVRGDGLLGSWVMDGAGGGLGCRCRVFMRFTVVREERK